MSKMAKLKMFDSLLQELTLQREEGFVERPNKLV